MSNCNTIKLSSKGVFWLSSNDELLGIGFSFNLNRILNKAQTLS